MLHSPQIISSTVRAAAAVGGAIAFVNAADGGNATATSLTFSYTVGAGSGRFIVVAVIGDTTTDDVTGVTYNAVPMTLAAKLNNAGGPSNRQMYLYWLVGPASGANNVIISASSSHFLGGGIAEYTGVNTSGQPDAFTTNVGTPNITSLATSITTVANNSWTILLENSFDSSLPPTAGTGLVRRTFDAAFGGWGLFDSNGAVTPAGSYSMTTNRANPVISIEHIAASFKP